MTILFFVDKNICDGVQFVYKDKKGDGVMHNGIPVRYGKPTRRKNSKIPMFIIIIIVLLVVGYIVCKFAFGDEQPVEEPIVETEINNEIKPAEEQKETPAPEVEEEEADAEEDAEEEEDKEKADEEAEKEEPSVNNVETVTDSGNTAETTTVPEPAVPAADIPPVSQPEASGDVGTAPLTEVPAE